MILSGRYGDPYGGQADWCRIRESWHVCHFEINHIHSMLLWVYPRGGGGGPYITANIWGGFPQTSTFFLVILLIISR